MSKRGWVICQGTKLEFTSYIASMNKGKQMPSTGRSEEIKVTYGLCALLQKLPEVESGLLAVL